MRKMSLVPADVDASVPEPYRLWRICQQWNQLWWPGGIANQPHILMLEFTVCAVATANFQDELTNVEKILSRGNL